MVTLTASSFLIITGGDKMTTIIFDVDDTLYDQLTPFQLAFEDVFHDPTIPIEELFKYSRIYSDEVFQQTEDGLISLLDMQIYRIRKAMEHYDRQITDQEGTEFQKNYQYYQSQLQLDPDMKEALDLCVQHKIQIGIITNGPSKHQQKKIRQLELKKWVPEKYIFVSGELGIAKPDIRVFQQVEEVMDLDKANTYYIGDSYPNDIIGAKRAGWQAIWVNRRNHPILSEEYFPDYIIDCNTKIQQQLLALITPKN